MSLINEQGFFLHSGIFYKHLGNEKTGNHGVFDNEWTVLELKTLTNKNELLSPKQVQQSNRSFGFYVVMRKEDKTSVFKAGKCNMSVGLQKKLYAFKLYVLAYR